jgi:ArsR family transcriptional regulator
MAVNIQYHRCMTTVLPLLESPLEAACCTPIARETIDQQQAEDLARALKAIADPARLRMLSLISAADDHEACVCDLVDELGLAQPTVSHHLKVLTDAGFLSRSKRGTWAYYRLIPGSLDALSRVLVTA